MESNIAHSGAASDLPPELRGWNWGAFALNWIWGIANRTYFALLVFVPFVGWLIVPFVLGVKGNAWAWRNRSWSSVAQFRDAQRRWARYAVLAYAGAAVAGVGLFLAVGYSLERSEAFALAKATLDRDSQVQALIGPPYETGMPMGGISLTGGGSGTTNMAFSLSGSKGEGKVYVAADKQLGRWALQSMELELPDGRRVALHDATSTPRQEPTVAPAIAAPEPTPAPQPTAAMTLAAVAPNAVLQVSGVNTEIRGDLPQARVEQLIQRHHNELRFCFAAQRVQSVSTTIEFNVLPSGAVAQPSVQPATEQGSPLASCLTSAVARWTFPAPKTGGSAQVRHTFSVTPRS